MNATQSIGSNTELIKTLINNSPIAYIIIDKEYRIRYINDSFAKLRSLNVSEAVGDKCYNIANYGTRCAECSVDEVVRTGEKTFISRKDLMPDGAVRYIDDYAIPLKKNDNGDVELVLEIMIDRTDEILARKKRDCDYDEILGILATLLEAKDEYTATHSGNVRKLSISLAHAMELPANDIYNISVAASLHDIGKVDIPYSIINKAGTLTDEEYDLIKKHTDATYKILNGLSSFAEIRNIARHHHERVDGHGYPDGLADKQIPLGAKIVAVADTYDAITSTRSYRHARSHEEALAEIQRAAGTQLDKNVVNTFVNMNFGWMITSLSDMGGTRHVRRVERRLAMQTRDVIPPVDPSAVLDEVDLGKLLDIVMRNTPCGYVLMDQNRNVLYASDYFLDYVGLKKEDVLGKVCFDSGGIGSKPCNGCPIMRSLRTGKTERTRQEQYTNRGRKVCDVYGVALENTDGNIERVLKIVIDRTMEAEIDREHQENFRKLIDNLTVIFERHRKEFYERNLYDQIMMLRNRLNKLLYGKHHVNL